MTIEKQTLRDIIRKSESDIKCYAHDLKQIADGVGYLHPNMSDDLILISEGLFDALKALKDANNDTTNLELNRVTSSLGETLSLLVNR